MAGIWIPNGRAVGNVIAVPGKGRGETETGGERKSCHRRWTWLYLLSINRAATALGW